MSIYKHVVVVGIDGMGNFNRIADTPNFDRIFRNGATTYDALSMFPTISAQNWAAMLLGTDPETHQMTNESLNEGPHADDSPYPSICRILRKVYPDAKLASFCDWDPINYGIIEQGCQVEFRHKGREELAHELADYFVKEKPMFLFSQFDNCDHGGHCNGYGAQGHLDEITLADQYTGIVYDAIKASGVADETLFLVITDHGGTPDGEHGGWTTGEKYIFFGAVGYDVPHGKIGPMRTCDLAAIVLHALGVDVPVYTEGGWISQIPEGIFSAPVAPYRMYEEQTEPKQTPATPDLHDPEHGLLARTPKRVKLHSAFFFDGKASDALCRSSTDMNGLVKFYSHGIYGSYGEFGRTGSLTICDPGFEHDFTIGFWVVACGSLEAVLLGNGSVDNPDTPGFTLTVEDHCYVFTMGNGKTHMKFRFDFDVTRDVWTHLFLSVDRTKREIRFGRGFKSLGILSYDASYDAAFDAKTPFRIGNDTTNTKNEHQVFPIDDLLIFEDALNHCEFASIGRYYQQ